MVYKKVQWNDLKFNMNSKEIFFHIGVERTGTKYVQGKVFPFFEGVHYINKKNYKNYQKIIDGTDYDKYLVSFELNLSPQFEREIKKFSALYPDTKVIMVMRKQHSWIASHYKRIVKNGNNITFNQFLDMENDASVYSKSDLLYYDKLMLLKKYFHEKPLVLFYDELRIHPFQFIDKVVKYMCVSYKKETIDLERKHTSYSLKQLKAIKKTMKFVNIERKKIAKNKVVNFVYRLYVDAIRYSVMYTAKVLPDSWFDEAPLIDKATIEKVKNYYKNDWDRSVAYVNEHHLNG